jgi:transcription initiation factor IIE alpha subunit
LVKEIADHINDKIDENEKHIKSSKIDRAKILLDAFQKAFDFNEDEMDILTGIVQFMIDRKLINHFTLSKKTVNAMKRAIRFLSKIYKVIA